MSPPLLPTIPLEKVGTRTDHSMLRREQTQGRDEQVKKSRDRPVFMRAHVSLHNQRRSSCLGVVSLTLFHTVTQPSLDLSLQPKQADLKVIAIVLSWLSWDDRCEPPCPV